MNQKQRLAWASHEISKWYEMFRALRSAYEKLADKSGITEEDVTFGGFDQHNEWDYYSASHGPNSHKRMRPQYERMYSLWLQCKDKENLTAEDVRRIVMWYQTPS